MDGLSFSGEVDAKIGPIGGHLHRSALLLHGDGAGLGVRLCNSDEAVWLGVWQRADERAVDEAEHRGVAADPQRQRKRRDHSQAGMLTKHPKAVAQVLP